MDYAVQQFLNALSFGAEYALIALGLAIVFSIMGLVNFAHGEVIAFGGYSLAVVGTILTGNPLILMGFVLLACVAVAVLLEKVAFRTVRDADITTGLLTAFGVSIILQNVFLLLGSPRPVAATQLIFLDRTLWLGPVQVSSLQIYETVATILAIAGLGLFLTRSNLGIAMRAAARDFEMVRLCGLRANRVVSGAFAISGLLAGLACIFIMARRGSAAPHMGFDPVLTAFVACVVGGFGSLPGAVLGGFLLGFLEVGMLVLLPQSYGGLARAAVFAMVALVLIWRPDGILSPASEKGDKI
ncbi:branched-chain amino acid ABC transporter, permease protein [Oceanicola granulosus HTCC2516]|uniref:Branched-chain amino acid ABC transporter, permease protein n=1 Tax=Oceanicola granulosus (strain ATCC BAA-861 / DSM 15982 / KCTC 12143 / HTCC2516) TaxID=314256 RepID=Q2CEU1_OCEGH|nr:branched-chain amino acid ABC transporter permease [Oceanicola granulosus]EAR51167.1 branched-chain amino acid ABC transporter, permease protein [Oceanicola granulosus HTCC2516]